jgi:hypothetical protein
MRPLEVLIRCLAAYVALLLLPVLYLFWSAFFFVVPTTLTLAVVALGPDDPNSNSRLEMLKGLGSLVGNVLYGLLHFIEPLFYLLAG